MKKYSFEAVILQHENMDAGYIEFPCSVQQEFGVRGRVKVLARFDGYQYRGSLVKMGGDCHILGITKEIRKVIGKSFGDLVKVEIEQDNTERSLEIPKDLTERLDVSGLLENFRKLSFTHQKEYVTWLESAKKQETREKRKEKIIVLLEKN